MGILEPTLSELVELPATGRIYCERWETWLAEHPEVRVGLAIQNMRAGIPAPELEEERRHRRYRLY